MTLIRDKYSLHIINKIVNIIDPLRDLVYTYKYKKIITLNTNDSYNAYNTFNLVDHLKSYIQP